MTASHYKASSSKTRLIKTGVLVLFCALAVAPSLVYAKLIECNIDSTGHGPTYLEFNTETKTAEILFSAPIGILHGRLTLVSKAANGTDAYNFMFSHLPKKWVGNDVEWEFVLHRNTGDFVLLGVGYTFVHGERYMSSTHDMHSARCISG